MENVDLGFHERILGASARTQWRGEHFIARTTGVSSSAKEIIQKCRVAAVVLVGKKGVLRVE